MCKRILIVDDDARLVSALQVRLLAAGFVVHTAHDGELGLSQAALLHPDVILLDIRMPEMDGLSVCQYVRGVPELQDVPIIVLSAAPDCSIGDKVIEAGGQAFLRKPYDPAKLMDLIHEISRRRAEDDFRCDGGSGGDGEGERDNDRSGNGGDGLAPRSLPAC
jgi:DNA-binding response OmpR family regulator